MNKREANKLARKIAKVNTAMWMAIGLAEELMDHPVVHLLVNNYDGEDDRLYEQLAESFRTINKVDRSFISTELHGRTLDDYDDFVTQLEKFLDGE